MESATIFTPLSTGFSGILLSVRTQYSGLKDQTMTNINTISMYREKFYQLHAAQRQLLRLLNNLEKTDPSEIEKTYNIKKISCLSTYATNVKTRPHSIQKLFLC